MIFSNTYFRAFVFSVLIFVGVMLVSFQVYGVDHWSGRRGVIDLSMVGVSLAITIALVGTFSRAEKPWPWLKTGLACFGCWLVTSLILAILVIAFLWMFPF